MGDAAGQVEPVPWLARRRVILPLMTVLYPVGLWLLLRSPRVRGWVKAAIAVVLSPCLALQVLLPLKPYWEFEGALRNLSHFSLDFDRGESRERRLEEHRRRQRAAATRPAEAAPMAGAWPGFRGPRRDGVVVDDRVSLDWGKAPPLELYRQPIGGGYSSFAVGGGRAFTLEQRREREAVTCYDVATGRELWAYDYPARFTETMGGEGPRSTPTLDGGRLYALGAEGHLHCLNVSTGRPLWSKNVLADFGQSNLYWGLSASPLIVDRNVVVFSSGKGGPSVIAFDAATGEFRWSSHAGVQCFASPMEVVLAGRRQLLDLADAMLQGLDPADGRVLWSWPWEMVGGPSCAQPLVAGPDRVFVSSGYGKGGAMLEVAESGGGWQVREVWTSGRMKNKFASSVLHDGAIFGLDEGVLACLDAATGGRRWKGGRYGHGSLLLLRSSRGDRPAHLLILGEQGELALVPADAREFHEAGRVRIFHGRTWNNFAVVAGRLLARNHKEMACFALDGTPRPGDAK